MCSFSKDKFIFFLFLLFNSKLYEVTPNNESSSDLLKFAWRHKAHQLLSIDLLNLHPIAKWKTLLDFDSQREGSQQFFIWLSGDSPKCYCIMPKMMALTTKFLRLKILNQRLRSFLFKLRVKICS